jgi:hypothetical protein
LKTGKGRVCRRLTLQLAFLAAIACGALALWPARVGFLDITGDAFAQFRHKLAPLQSGAAAGPVEFSENEASLLLNYLILQNRPPPFNAGRFAVTAGRVVINPETITVYLRGRLKPWRSAPDFIAPFPFTCRITGRPERKNGGLCFTVQRGAVGHLPLPALGRLLGKRCLKQFFSPFKNARSFLESLEITAMKKESIAVFRE